MFYRRFSAKDYLRGTLLLQPVGIKPQLVLWVRSIFHINQQTPLHDITLFMCHYCQFTAQLDQAHVELYSRSPELFRCFIGAREGCQNDLWKDFITTKIFKKKNI